MSKPQWGRFPKPVVVLILALAVTVSACGFPEMTDPIGEPMLPDLVPEPPVDLRVTVEGNATMARFSSTLVNIGAGDFILRSERIDGEWVVEQEIWYTEGGGELVPTAAEMAWGGDGHDHWHIRRVASYRLVPLDEGGNPVEDGLFRVDSKIGFCFFDFSRVFDTGPDDAAYDIHDCGHKEDDAIRMGMSKGWADVYDFTLPGQSVDITIVPDGMYRLWAEADASGWFTEVTRDNNVTWIDFELLTVDGKRFARLESIGPEPGD